MLKLVHHVARVEALQPKRRVVGPLYPRVLAPDGEPLGFEPLDFQPLDRNDADGFRVRPAFGELDGIDRSRQPVVVHLAVAEQHRNSLTATLEKTS